MWNRPNRLLSKRPDLSPNIMVRSDRTIRQTMNVNAEVHSLITVDSLVCHGQAFLKGTRIPVSVVLDCLGAGMTAEEIGLQYPSLSGDAVRAAASYGAALAREEVLPLAGDR